MKKINQQRWLKDIEVEGRPVVCLIKELQALVLERNGDLTIEINDDEFEIHEMYKESDEEFERRKEVARQQAERLAKNKLDRKERTEQEEREQLAKLKAKYEVK